MDILSDINVSGSLKVSSSFCAGLVSFGIYKDKPIMSVNNLGSEIHYGVEEHKAYECHSGVEEHNGQECHYGSEFHNGREYHYGFENHGGDEIHGGVVEYNSQVYFKRTGVCTSGGVENHSQSLSPSENWITIPANCTRFLIKTYDVCAFYNDDELSLEDKHILIHPLVTAWSDGKTVELDLEICAEIKDGSFYEYLLGKVTSSSTEREMNIVMF